MESSILQDLVTELVGEISDTVVAIKEFAEPLSFRIIAPCISGLEDGMKRLENLETRLETVTESQLRAELITIVRKLLATFEQLKRTERVELSWYEGDPESGLPAAIIRAREILGL